ncbi:MAG: hypothetical protein KGL39_41110 [Patescibacteria group bacterium]|nr:hypothetical protein [Patescibacteria group bacterium]
MFHASDVLKNEIAVSVALPMDVEGLDADRLEHAIAANPDVAVFRATFTKPPATWSSVQFFYMEGETA